MVALKALVVLLAAFAFATIGFNVVVNLPRVSSAKAEFDRLPNLPPPLNDVDFRMSDAERNAMWDRQRRLSEEYGRKRDEVSERYFELRDRRDLYSAGATGAGVLAFLLSIAATWKRAKGLLVFGGLTAALTGVAWVAVTMASDGHL
jgi:hypothetical protein